MLTIAESQGCSRRWVNRRKQESARVVQAGRSVDFEAFAPPSGTPPFDSNQIKPLVVGVAAVQTKWY